MRSRTQNPNVQRLTLAYIRVSSEEQKEHGVSLDAQAARIGAYAVAMGWDVSEVVRDPGHSAKTLARPGMARILDAVRAGRVERVIVTKLDRLVRSTRDLADVLDLFARTNTALVSIGETLDTQSAAGRMVVGFLGVVAQWERESCAERTSAALAHKRACGRVYGRVPFGYARHGDALVPHPEEQAARA